MRLQLVRWVGRGTVIAEGLGVHCESQTARRPVRLLLFTQVSIPHRAESHRHIEDDEGGFFFRCGMRGGGIGEERTRDQGEKSQKKGPGGDATAAGAGWVGGSWDDIPLGSVLRRFVLFLRVAYRTGCIEKRDIPSGVDVVTVSTLTKPPSSPRFSTSDFTR